jgi:hypothetical protein
LSASRGNWDTLSSSTRSIVAVTYGQATYSGYAIYLTPIRAVEKWKARGMILRMIVEGVIETA